MPHATPVAHVPGRALLRALAMAVASGASALLLAGCVGTTAKTFEVQENFGSVATYSRLFDATPVQTCEASRRALLSQGYVISTQQAELIEGKKAFSPRPNRTCRWWCVWCVCPRPMMAR